MATTRKERADTLFIIPDPSWDSARRVADFALKHRLPAIGTERPFAEAGVLMAYGTDFTRLWHRATTYVDKILKGSSPSELPIEYPTKFDLVINVLASSAINGTGACPSCVM